MNDFELLKAKHYALKIAVWVEDLRANTLTDLHPDLVSALLYLQYYSDGLNEALEKADLDDTEADVRVVLRGDLYNE